MLENIFLVSNFYREFLSFFKEHGILNESMFIVGDFFGFNVENN